MSADAFPLTCPYVGLQPYTEKERAYFFGRERDTRVIAANLQAASLTVLYGASGVGKSSVLMAGVVPQLLAAGRTAVVVHREWQHTALRETLVAQCRAAVERVTEKTLSVDDTLPFDAWLAAAVAESHVAIVLILDQFEEYFLYHAQSESPDSFDAQFARAVNRVDVPVSFLLALREDGLSKLDRFRARIPNLLANLLRLEAMDAKAAGDAIREPLVVWSREHGAQFGIEEALVAAVIEQVSGGGLQLGSATGRGETEASKGDTRIETPFLQLVLRRLWEEERRAGSKTMRLETLRKLGDASQIVSRHLDEVMDRLDARQREACARIFDRLVTPSGTKFACAIVDLKKWAEEFGDAVEPALAALEASDSRLLRRIAPAPGSRRSPSVEIFHDVLAPAVLAWCSRVLAEQARKQETEKAEEAAREYAKRRFARWLVALIALATLAAAYAVWASFAARIATLEAEAAQRDLEAAQKDLENERLLLADERDAASMARRELDVRSLDAALAQQEVLSITRAKEPSVPTPDARAGLVYVQIQCDQQRGVAAEAKRLLVTSDFAVTAPERLDVGPTSISEVRYFRKEDSARAERAAEALHRMGRVWTMYVPPARDARSTPGGQLELWIARDLGCPARTAAE
jgi:hypothetical protein